MKKKVGARVLSLLLSCVLLGTMLPAAVASADPADPTYSITVAPPSIDLVEGDEGELTAKVVSESTDGTKTELDDAGLAVAGLSIRWESKDKGRVSVESPNTLTTKVMAVKTGETTDEKKVTITAYLNSGTDDIGKASCEITVKPAVTPGISIDPPAVTEIDIGQTLKLNAKVTPEGAPLTWRSESPSVATVNSATGEVKGMAPGKAVITAISGSNPDTCEITVKGILLDETSLTMNERDTHTLKANPYGSLGTLKWTSSKPEIVTVTGDGYLYAKAQGEDAVITVSDASGNYQAACSVTVKRNTADIIFGSAGVGSRWPSPPFAPNCKTSAAACWEALCAISAD
ncbi:MAG: Ig-like domain-containing protein [Flavonifractor plautii]